MYGVDNVGRRRYTLRVKDLSTGETLADEIPNTTGNVAWANDDKTLFYGKQDPQTLRSYQIWRHSVGSDPADDVLVYEETDDTFSCYVGKTKSKRYLVIRSDQTLSTEARILDANDPTGAFEVFLPRRRNHEYDIDHHGGHFYVRTNEGARNFRLARTPVADTSMESWEEVLEHREDVFLQGFDVFAGHLVVNERKDGLVQLRYPRLGPARVADDRLRRAGLPRRAPTQNLNYDTSLVRYAYSSMTTPNSIYEYDMERGEATLLKRDEVLLGFDNEDYVTERLYATARDGTRVPISLVYRNGIERDGQNPLLLTGYGSYGSSSDASFRSSRVSLLDRGFVIAIAHVRGGSEMGRAWYEDGKLLKKKNTFTDFIDCAEHLVGEGFTSPEHLLRLGRQRRRSADGRRHANMRPDLFNGLIAYVPFVDVVTTMLDDSIPLTTVRVRRVGQPQREGVLRVHAVLLALRPGRGQGLPQPPRHDRPARLPGPVLGARQVGREAARDEDGHEPAADQDRHGSRPRRRLRTGRPLPRHRVRVRVPGGPGGRGKALAPAFPQWTTCPQPAQPASDAWCGRPASRPRQKKSGAVSGLPSTAIVAAS